MVMVERCIMDKNGNMTRKEACYFLGIREDAAEEQIKRAYRYKAKLYHPDANPNQDTKEYYIRVQKAYECLMSSADAGSTPPGPQQGQAAHKTAAVYPNNPYGYAGWNPMYNNPFYANSAGTVHTDAQGGAAAPRPAKVYASSAAAKASYKRQKEKEKEREKIQKWDEEYKSNKRRQQQTALYGKEYTEKMTGSSRSKEDEILEKIRAIWLAETIRRQIELDKEHREVLQRRKLYQAFMQQQANEEPARRASEPAAGEDARK